MLLPFSPPFIFKSSSEIRMTCEIFFVGVTKTECRIEMMKSVLTGVVIRREKRRQDNLLF